MVKRSGELVKHECFVIDERNTIIVLSTTSAAWPTVKGTNRYTNYSIVSAL